MMIAEEQRTKTTARRVPAQGYASQSQRDLAQRVIDDLDQRGKYQPRASQAAPRTKVVQQRRTRNTDEDQEITTRPGRQTHTEQLPDPGNPKHWTFHFGAGMVSILIAITLGLNAFAWWMNTIGDPMYYTQLAHREVVEIPAQGGQEQIRAFVDAQDHLDVMIIPEDGKARIIQGPLLPFAQQAMLSIKVTGQDVEVLAQGPYIYGLSLNRPQAEWKVNIQNGKGGQR